MYPPKITNQDFFSWHSFILFELQQCYNLPQLFRIHLLWISYIGKYSIRRCTFSMYIASNVSFSAFISSFLTWKHLSVSSKTYFPVTYLPVLQIIHAEFILLQSHFIFNERPISHFLFISSRSLFRSSFWSKTSRQRFASPNQKLINFLRVI